MTKTGDRIKIPNDASGSLLKPHRNEKGTIITKHDTRGMRFGSLSYDIKLDDGNIIKNLSKKQFIDLPKGIDEMEKGK